MEAPRSASFSDDNPSAKEDREGASTALVETQKFLLNIENITRENHELKLELQQSASKIQQLEMKMISELSNNKRLTRSMEDHIEELEIELEESKKSQLISTLNTQTSAADLTALKASKEAAQLENVELKANLVQLTQKEKRMTQRLNDLSDELSASVTMNDMLEQRIQRLESDMRERDKEEAARDSSDQAKHHAEDRAARMESKLISLHKTKESLKAALGRRDNEYRALFEEKQKASKDAEAARMETSLMKVSVEDSAIIVADLEEKVRNLEAELEQHQLSFQDIVERNEKSIEDLSLEQERSEQLQQNLEKKSNELKKALTLLERETNPEYDFMNNPRSRRYQQQQHQQQLSILQSLEATASLHSATVPTTTGAVPASGITTDLTAQTTALPVAGSSSAQSTNTIAAAATPSTTTVMVSRPPTMTTNSIGNMNSIGNKNNNLSEATMASLTAALAASASPSSSSSSSSSSSALGATTAGSIFSLGSSSNSSSNSNAGTMDATSSASASASSSTGTSTCGGPSSSSSSVNASVQKPNVPTAGTVAVAASSDSSGATTTTTTATASLSSTFLSAFMTTSITNSPSSSFDGTSIASFQSPTPPASTTVVALNSQGIAAVGEPQSHHNAPILQQDGARNVSFDGTECSDKESGSAGTNTTLVMNTVDAAYTSELEDKLATLSIEKHDLDRKNKLINQELVKYQQSHEATQKRIKDLSAKLIKLSDFEFKEQETARKLQEAVQQLTETQSRLADADRQHMEYGNTLNTIYGLAVSLRDTKSGRSTCDADRQSFLETVIDLISQIQLTATISSS